MSTLISEDVSLSYDFLHFRIWMLSLKRPTKVPEEQGWPSWARSFLFFRSYKDCLSYMSVTGNKNEEMYHSLSLTYKHLNYEWPIFENVCTETQSVGWAFSSFLWEALADAGWKVPSHPMPHAQHSCRGNPLPQGILLIGSGVSSPAVLKMGVCPHFPRRTEPFSHGFPGWTVLVHKMLFNPKHSRIISLTCCPLSD